MSPVTDDEAALWAALRSDEEIGARNRLFVIYQPLARRIATRLYRERQLGDLEFADVYQLACTGLIEAIDHYRPELGVPFRYYGNRRIAGSILDGLSHMSEYREQAHAQRRLQRERLTSIVPERKNKHAATDLDVALHELGEIAAELALGFMLEDSGLIAGDEVDTEVSPYDSLAWRGMTERLAKELRTLSEREHLIISYHYLGAMPFERIAQLLGLTKGRISQLHKSAIGTLRKRLIRSGLETIEG